MDYRQLGQSGLRVSAISFGTATFGSGSASDAGRSYTEESVAARLIDVALDHGITLFDTSDVYRTGQSEAMLGRIVKERRRRLLLSTKLSNPTGQGQNDYGSSRSHLIDALDASLKRLDTDHVDLLQMHHQDPRTPVEETMAVLDGFVKAGKVRYLGCSNFAAWHMTKANCAAERRGLERYVSHQVYYSLLDRDYEWELMPAGLDQGVGALVFSALAWGRLTGKIRRDTPAKPGTRAGDPKVGIPVQDEERLHRIVDALDEISQACGRTISQVAIAWLLARPTISSVIVGASSEAQLIENCASVGWSLSDEQVAALEAVSVRPLPYPAWQNADVSPLYR